MWRCQVRYSSWADERRITAPEGLLSRFGAYAVEPTPALGMIASQAYLVENTLMVGGPELLLR
jgi:hypothetical protein